MKNIVFAWWWSWGHVFPIKSLIEYIYENEEINWKIKEIYWIGNNKWLEYEIFSKIKVSKLKFVHIYSWKLRREISVRSFLLNIKDFFLFLFWIIQSIFFLKKHSIDMIFCKWWYVALPIVLAWWLLKKKIIVHESDSVPWLANKIASKFSIINFCAYPNALKNCIDSWQIIWNELLKYQQNQIDLSQLDTKKTNILVFAWSQGSKFIFDLLLELFHKDIIFFNDFNFVIILWTLNRDYKSRFKKYDFVKCIEFASQSQVWYLCNFADIGITRGWATSMAEQKLFWLKLLIIPLPYTWWNHQYFNWKHYQEKYWDILIDQNLQSWQILKHNMFKLKSFKKEQKNILDINNTKSQIIAKILEL